MQQKSELPEGWAESQIKDIVVINYGKGLKKSDRVEGQFDVFGSNGVIGKHNQFLTNGPTIIIGRKGSVGEINISSESCWPIDTTYYIDNFYGISRTFLYYLLKTLDLANYDTSTAIPGINRNDIYSQVIPLPSLPEQHRIVSAIEALFARLDATNEKLDSVPAILKAFRQAVIKLALQGKLVEQNPADEPVLKLIETVRTDLTKDKMERKKLVSIDSEENIFELPYSWKWIRLGEVLTFGPKNGYSPKPVNYVTNVRALTLTATTSGKFRDDCFKYIDEEIDAKSHLWLKENDILIQRGNTIEYVGVAAIYKGASNAFIYPDLMMKIRVHPKINVEFLHMVINSKFSRKYFEKKATGTSGSMPKINQTTIVNLPIPLPPLPEQQEIVRRVDALFAFADSIELKVVAAREKTEKLRQSILAKAFSGQLVETEAEIARREGREYETAEVLIERIKVERGKVEKGKSKKK